jgi:hypothetical protein
MSFLPAKAPRSVRKLDQQWCGLMLWCISSRPLLNGQAFFPARMECFFPATRRRLFEGTDIKIA